MTELHSRETAILVKLKPFLVSPRLELEFDLIMVLEYFDESMVLLKDLLGSGVTLKELAYFKHNALSDNSRYVSACSEFEVILCIMLNV